MMTPWRRVVPRMPMMSSSEMVVRWDGATGPVVQQRVEPGDFIGVSGQGAQIAPLLRV